MNEIEQIERAAREIHPLLAGRRPEVQGAILADLLATWLAVHPTHLRDEILSLHVDTVRLLIPVNERRMFDERLRGQER
jgi:hypothetical protein